VTKLGTIKRFGGQLSAGLQKIMPHELPDGAHNTEFEIK